MAVIKLTTELAHEEYLAKKVLLERAGKWVSPEDFYAVVLHTDDFDKPTMMVEAGETFRVMTLSDILETAVYDGKQNWYISMADYFQDCLKQDLLDTLHAFVMDIDFIRPRALELILEGMQMKRYPVPTYIVNSGTGLHFYYVLDKGLSMYRSQRRQAKNLLKEMHYRYESVYAQIGIAQTHWLGQPYRVVGSMTKAEDVVKAYQTGDIWRVEALAEAFEVKWQPKLEKNVKQQPTEKMVALAQKLAAQNNVEICDLSDFKATYNFIDRESKKKRNMGGFDAKKAISDNGSTYEGWQKPSKQWYRRTVYEIQKYTQEGYRYTSLMAMAVIAIKCGISFEELEHDAWRQADIWYEDIVRYSTVFKRNNVPDALRMYDYKYVKVTRKQLEDWLGWTFQSHVKRNGRKREDHLILARTMRDTKNMIDGTDWRENNGRKPKKEQVKIYLKNHPDAKKAEIARETGLSRTTVVKWYPVAMQEIEAEKAVLLESDPRLMEKVFRLGESGVRSVELISDEEYDNQMAEGFADWLIQQNRGTK